MDHASFGEIKYRRVIAKARATSKESRRKKNHNAPILHTRKNGQKIISYSSKLHRFRS
jgi:hypothetical protein